MAVVVGVAVAVAGVGLVSSITAWVSYLSTVPSGNVPARPVAAIALAIGGTLAAGASIALGYRSPGAPGIAVVTMAGLTALLGPLFLYVLTQRRTPIGDLRVKVGDRLLPFASQTSDGVGFHTDELAGKRVLLKFFRGHW